MRHRDTNSYMWNPFIHATPTHTHTCDTHFNMRHPLTYAAPRHPLTHVTPRHPLTHATPRHSLRALSLSHFQGSLFITYTHTHAFSLSVSHTHTHTRILSLSRVLSQRGKITLPKDNHNAGRHRHVGRRLATDTSERKDNIATPMVWAVARCVGRRQRDAT